MFRVVIAPSAIEREREKKKKKEKKAERKKFFSFFFFFFLLSVNTAHLFLLEALLHPERTMLH